MLYCWVAMPTSSANCGFMAVGWIVVAKGRELGHAGQSRPAILRMNQMLAETLGQVPILTVIGLGESVQQDNTRFHIGGASSVWDTGDVHQVDGITTEYGIRAHLEHHVTINALGG